VLSNFLKHHHLKLKQLKQNSLSVILGRRRTSSGLTEAFMTSASSLTSAATNDNNKNKYGGLNSRRGCGVSVHICKEQNTQGESAHLRGGDSAGRRASSATCGRSSCRPPADSSRPPLSTCRSKIILYFCPALSQKKRKHPAPVVYPRLDRPQHHLPN
jgi:hypothetical protein